LFKPLRFTPAAAATQPPCWNILLQRWWIDGHLLDLWSRGEEMKNFVSLRIPFAFCLIFASCALLANCARQTARNTQTDALFRATIEGNTDMVRSLVSSPGADVNATDEKGSTPLLEAARYGHDDVT